MNYARFTALLIDIDNTIVRFTPGYQSDCLFSILKTAGTKFSKLTAEEATARIERIKTEIRWWHWSDFIVALELNPKQFWEYAWEHEREYLGATGPELLSVLERLKNAGYLLYITSNNPSSGILHKLRLAGLGSVNEAPLFSQFLGPPEIQAMKWEPIYWKKVLAHTGLDASEVAIIGDDMNDDFKTPHSIGISHTFLINREKDQSHANTEKITHVMDFNEIAECLLGSREDVAEKPARATGAKAGQTLITSAPLLSSP